MKKNKKIGAMAAVIGLSTSLILAGCASKESSSSTSKNGTVLTWANDKSANWNNAMNTVGKDTAAKYGAGLKGLPSPDTTTYQASTKQALQGSNPPDVFSWWTGTQLEELVSSGKAADLTSEWQNYYEKTGLSPDLAKPFTVNGKIYGAPLYVSYWVVHYNKKVFDQYGLQPPKTWDDFLNICSTLKQKGVTPLGQSSQGWPGFIWFEELLTRSAGVDFYNQLMEGKASYTDPKVVKVMELWKELEDKGYFSKPLNAVNEDYSALAKGKIGMYLMGQWWQTGLIQAGLKPGKDYGTFILPNVDPNAGNLLIFETSPLVVSENGPHKEQALKALRNFFQKDSQQKWDDLNGFSPIVKGVTTSNPANQSILDSLNSTNYTLVQRYWEATPSDISQFAVQEFDKFELKPETYMEDLQAIQKYAEQYWSTHK